MSGRADRLAIAISAHGLMRIASSASAVLIGVYLASLARQQSGIDAGLLGMLGAVSFGAELLFSIPLGVLSDAVSPRWLMAGGAATGALAIQLFVFRSRVPVFFLSRALEGIGVAAVTPPLLGLLTDATASDGSLRARAMSFFELSLLAGLALGGLIGTEFWSLVQVRAFSAIAVAYLASGAFLLIGGKGSRSHGGNEAIRGLRWALSDPSVLALAPVWLCVNAIVGLWLGPTLPFLLTHRPRSRQFLDGIFSGRSTDVAGCSSAMPLSSPSG